MRAGMDDRQVMVGMDRELVAIDMGVHHDRRPETVRGIMDTGREEAVTDSRPNTNVSI